MYAVIRAGGKQHKVKAGDVLEIERVKDDGDVVEFVPLLVVDDQGNTVSAKAELADARVVARVMGETKGPKVEVLKFRSKTGYRRHTGHRQMYSSIQISDIKLSGAGSEETTRTAEEE